MCTRVNRIHVQVTCKEMPMYTIVNQVRLQVTCKKLSMYTASTFTSDLQGVSHVHKSYQIHVQVTW